MDWDDLRIFLALARSRRLGAAARTAGQNATTIARRVRRLEAELQATLFEQGVAGYSLTENGKLLLARAEIMEAEALDIARAISGVGPDLHGTIRVSVAEGFGSHVLAPRLHAFTHHHPGVTIDLIASTGFLNPSRREADVAVMLSRPQRGPLLVRKLTDYKLGLYGRRDSGDTDAGIATLADLIGRPVTGYVPDMIYAPELHYLEELDSRIKATVRSSSIIAQSALIASGAGRGVLPCFMGDTSPQLSRLLHEEVAITRTFWLVSHRDARRVARIERFVGWLVDLVAELQPILLGG